MCISVDKICDWQGDCPVNFDDELQNCTGKVGVNVGGLCLRRDSKQRTRVCKITDKAMSNYVPSLSRPIQWLTLHATEYYRECKGKILALYVGSLCLVFGLTVVLGVCGMSSILHMFLKK